MFGTRLNTLRKEHGYTLEELAQIYNQRFDAGLNKGTLSKYEHNKQEPMISVVINLASIFQVPIDFLLGKTDCRDFLSDQKTIIYDIKKEYERILSKLEHSQRVQYDNVILTPAEQKLLALLTRNSMDIIEKMQNNETKKAPKPNN